MKVQEMNSRERVLAAIERLPVDRVSKDIRATPEVWDAVETLGEVLSRQQDLVLKKAKTMLPSGTPQQKRDAAPTITLIGTSRNMNSVAAAGNILHPSVNTARANALVAARRLVGGVEIRLSRTCGPEQSNIDIEIRARESNR